MKDTLISTFERMIDVNTPIIYIQDYDFYRVDQFIKSAIKDSSIQEWNPATYSSTFEDLYKKENKGGTIPLTSFLSSFLKEEDNAVVKEKYLVLRNIDEELEKPEIITLLQLISQRRLNEEPFNTTIIIVSSRLTIPTDLEKFISILEIPFPSEEEINQIIDEHTEVNQYRPLSKEDRQKLMPSLKGLTRFEIDRMLDMAMSSNGTLSAADSKMLLEQKKSMVKKSGLVELIDTYESKDDIGGLDILKEYLSNKAQVIQNLADAQNHGVATPKGILLVGMPGCGKSLSAKAAASTFGVPLLKMDIGTMMGKYVGESEGNFRKAIQIAEAASPCVLWIDEVEKAFSGIGTDESGISTRLFGYFLSWMQDKKSSVYVIATANNVEKLPPELKRKGRFDETFCVNLPNEEERKQIFKVHLNKNSRKGCQGIQDIAKNDDSLRQLVNATNGFNGADIESIINESVEQSYISKQTISTDLILKIAKETISISKSCKDQIDSMKKEFEKNNFKNASKETNEKRNK